MLYRRNGGWQGPIVIARQYRAFRDEFAWGLRRGACSLGALQPCENGSSGDNCLLGAASGSLTRPIRFWLVEVRSMLIPRFSIRAALAVVSGCAVVFLIAGMAARGQAWAWGVTIGVFSLAVTALVHASWFGIVWLFAQLDTQSAPVVPQQPQSSGGQEPQIEE